MLAPWTLGGAYGGVHRGSYEACWSDLDAERWESLRASGLAARIGVESFAR